MRKLNLLSLILATMLFAMPAVHADSDVASAVNGMGKKAENMAEREAKKAARKSEQEKKRAERKAKRDAKKAAKEVAKASETATIPTVS